jgi:tetratricopeptide (TPR) repeat protein
VKPNRNFSKHLVFTAAAVPIGALGGFLCAVVILFVSSIFNWLLHSPHETLHLSFFFEFDLPMAAYFGVPVGTVLLPLAYLLFLRHITSNQVLWAIGWLFSGAIVMGIIGSVLISFVSVPAAIGFLAGIFYVLRKTCPERKLAKSRMILGSVALIAVAVVMTPVAWISGMFWAMHGIKQIEKQLNSPIVYQTVATNLALYCQSISSLNLTDGIGGARLPQPLPQFGNHLWGSFHTNSAFVEFGGGFYHYGYSLELNKATSDANTNSWELYFCSESSPNKLLMHFTLSPDARMPLAAFVSNTLTEFSRRLAADPTSLDAHKGRIRFLLEYNRIQVRQACLDAIKALPEHWWPRLTLALWDSGRERFAEASKTFTEFAARKPSYSRYIYLAWFYQTMKRPDEAAASVEKAIQCPIVDLIDDENNTECRGYSVGVFAYQNGKYGTVIKLCDAFLPIRENGEYAKPALAALRTAAVAALDGKPENFRSDERVLGFNPYKQMELDALLGH